MTHQFIERARDYRDETLGRRIRKMYQINIETKSKLRQRYAELFNREKEIRRYDCSLDLYALELRVIKAKKKHLSVTFGDIVMQNRFIENVTYIHEPDLLNKINSNKTGLNSNENKTKPTGSGNQKTGS